MAAVVLMTLSAGILFALGLLHLVYTFWGPKLTPRDPALRARMSEVSPVITRETTMWRAWIGFNASHSMGAILFGLIYGFLAILHSQLLFQSPFLLVVGLGMLGGLFVLGKVYWFRIPFRALAFRWRATSQALSCRVPENALHGTPWQSNARPGFP